MEMRIYLTTDIELSEEQESWSHSDLEQWARDLIKSQPSYDTFDLSVAVYGRGETCDCGDPKDPDEPYCWICTSVRAALR